MEIVLYRCDICGKEEKWGPTWFQLTFMFGHGYRGWEHGFHICSPQCEKELRDMSKQDRQDLANKIQMTRQ